MYQYLLSWVGDYKTTLNVTDSRGSLSWLQGFKYPPMRTGSWAEDVFTRNRHLTLSTLAVSLKTLCLSGVVWSRLKASSFDFTLPPVRYSRRWMNWFFKFATLNRKETAAQPRTRENWKTPDMWSTDLAWRYRSKDFRVNARMKITGQKPGVTIERGV